MIACEQKAIPLVLAGHAEATNDRAALTNRAMERPMAKPIPTDIPDDVKARFWAKVDVRGPDECWPWLAYTSVHGYGQYSVRTSVRRITIRAHRFAYMVAVGSISSGLVVDHLCRNRACCNPSHLEAVTNTENVYRGIGPTSQNRQKTHCPKGHPLSGENLVIARSVGRNDQRRCRLCNRAARARYRCKRLTPLGLAVRTILERQSQP